MAKVAETIIVIKASRLLKDGEDSIEVLDDEALAQLTAVIEELAGPLALIEIDTMDGQQ
jgi:hypothetical protein|tara:strand:- start:479 stop:655 length:177 start_codon:yes stop_codon:yes gene_type:complete